MSVPETPRQATANGEVQSDSGSVPGSGAARSTHGRRRRLAWWAAAMVAAVALAVFGALTERLVVPARLVVFLAGLGLAYYCLTRLSRSMAGRPVDTTFWLSVAWLVLLIAVALLAPLLPLQEWADVSNSLHAPSYAGIDLGSAHPLGTNNYGLDLLARSVYGARTSLIVALSAVVLGSVVGSCIGIVAGFFRSGADTVIGIGTNAVLAVPPLILLIALAAVMQPNLRNIAIALSLLTIPSMVRLARANTMAFAEREFVTAARAMGATGWRVMTRELLPNVALPVLSLAMVMISVLIVAEASLSFLGLGVPPPQPTWGNMIAEGEGTVFAQHPYIVLIPGVFLFLTVFAFNLVDEKARERWDPRSAK